MQKVTTIKDEIKNSEDQNIGSFNFEYGADTPNRINYNTPGVNIHLTGTVAENKAALQDCLSKITEAEGQM